MLVSVSPFSRRLKRASSTALERDIRFFTKLGLEDKFWFHLNASGHLWLGSMVCDILISVSYFWLAIQLR